MLQLARTLLLILMMIISSSSGVSYTSTASGITGKGVVTLEGSNGGHSIHIPELTNVAGDWSLNFEGSEGAGGTAVFSSALRPLGDFSGLVVDFDALNPSVSSASILSDTEIQFTFSEPVRVIGDAKDRFLILDGANTSISVTAVNDNIIGDNNVTLEVSGGLLTSALGDLRVTYDSIGNTSTNIIADSTTATVKEASGGTGFIDLDTSKPSVSSARILSDTEIQFTFDEPVQLSSSGSSPYGFTILDGANISIQVTSVRDGTARDNNILLGVTRLTSAIGDLRVTYNGSGGIGDFGGNAANGGVVNIDRDASKPSVSSARILPNTNTEIQFTFDEPVQLLSSSGSLPYGFTIRDGTNTSIQITSVGDGTARDNNILLGVGNLTSVIGDLRVTYDGTSGGIEDFGGNTANSGEATIDLDNSVPTLVKADSINATSLRLEFSEIVQLVNAFPAVDFSLEDGAGNPIVVSVINDMTANDLFIELTTQDRSGFVGDLELTYTSTGSSIQDFGGNSLAGISSPLVIKLDNTGPRLVSAEKVNNQRIDIKFNERGQLLPSSPSSSTSKGFTFTDEAGNDLTGSLVMGGVEDGTAQDSIIVAHFNPNSLVNAIGDIIIDYNPTSGRVADFGVPPNVASSGSYIIDLNLTKPPTITENSTPLPDDDNFADLAMYRTDTNPSSSTPINITPSIPNGTIVIYKDALLTDIATIARNVAQPPYSPTIDSMMSDYITDWTASNNKNGIFTFYIVEEAKSGISSKSPPVQYNLAFLDNIQTSGQQNFRQSNTTGTNISLNVPVGQTSEIKGNGLTANTGTQARFVPLAAGSGNHQISITFKNDAGVEATFNISQLLFKVASTSTVFEPDARVAFSKKVTDYILKINKNPNSLDILDNSMLVADDPNNRDFFSIEVYHILNGAINDTMGDPGVYNNNGGNIGPEVLLYNGNKLTANSPSPTNGTPSYVENAWEFNASEAVKTLAKDSQEVDTLLFMTLSKPDRGAAGPGDPVQAFGDENSGYAYLFPEPQVKLSNLNDVYCQDEPGFTIEADIYTYTSTATSLGGRDEKGVAIRDGYKLHYNPNQVSNIKPTAFPFNRDFTAGGVGVTNEFDPGKLASLDLDNDTSTDGGGWYVIEYTSEELTAAKLQVTVYDTFFVAPTIEAPILTVPTMGYELKSGSYSGQKSSRDQPYIFEFCGGELIPFFNIDNTKPENIADNQNAYYWYSGLTNNRIGVPTDSLDPSLVIGQNPFNGNGTFNLYATRVLNGCQSDTAFLQLRIIDEPEAPKISTTESSPNLRRFDNSSYKNINVNDSDNNGADEYYFEYCATANTSSVAFDLLQITSNLEDIPTGREYIKQRSYFALYKGDTTLFDTLSYKPSNDYKIDLDLDLGLGTSLISGSNASDVVEFDFLIQKVVADTTIVPGTTFGGQLDLSNGIGFNGGCRSNDFTQVTVAIYTYPNAPEPGLFTGAPRISNSDLSNIDTVSYYMIVGEEFPSIGINDPNVAQNNVAFDWYADKTYTDSVQTVNRNGNVLTEIDLINHQASTLSSDDYRKDAIGVYTYFVRVRTNINRNSGFGGCESALTQVNVIVYPEADAPTPLTLTDDVKSELFSTTNLMPNKDTCTSCFDIEYDFCVTASQGLSADIKFSTSTSYNSSPTITNTSAGVPAESNEVLWLTANQEGTNVLNSNPVNVGFAVTARNLQIDKEKNSTFPFAVVHRADFIAGYNGFDGVFSDTTFINVNISTTPEPQFSYSGITAGKPTTFDLIDQTSAGATVDYNLDIYNVTANGIKGTLVRSFTGSADLSDPSSNVEMTFSKGGVYEVALLITSKAGCNTTETRRIRILDRLVLSGSKTFSFDSSDEGWFAEFRDNDGLRGSYGQRNARNSSWQFGFPSGSRIQTLSDGTGKAWTTTAAITDVGDITRNSTGTYVGGEESYVYSPSYDISSIDDPAIVIETYRDIDNKDGVAFQLSIDNGENWVTLGNFDGTREPNPSSGRNWYNESNIPSRPGSGAVNNSKSFNSLGYGWSGLYTNDEIDLGKETNGWLMSIHRLDEALSALEKANPGLSNLRSDVRFRFALSALGTFADDKTGEGFGFDNILIYSIQKNVLIEQFSSSLDAVSIDLESRVLSIAPQTLFINYFSAINNNDLGQDLLNQRNPIGPGARVTLYGIGEVPNTVLDGETITPIDSDNDGTIDSPGWDINDLEIKSLGSASFLMDLGTDGVILNPSNANNISVTASWRYTGSKTLENGDFSIYFALIEREIDATGIGLYKEAGISKIKNVFRTFLPNSDGNPFSLFKGNISNGDVLAFSASWDISNVYDVNQLRVIAFLQNNKPNDDGYKEILQAGYVDIKGKSVLVAGIENELSDFELYPNPANEGFIVEFAQPMRENTDWVLYDQAGQEVVFGSLERGSKLLDVNTEDVPSGLYFIHIYGKNPTQQSKRVIVIH